MAFADLADVLEWTLAPLISSHPYSSSDTSGAKNRVMGVTDWTATVRVLAQGAAPVLSEGIKYSFHFIEHQDIGGGPNPGFHTGIGWIVSIDTGASPDDGGPVEYTYNIEGEGAMSAFDAGANSAPFSAKEGDVEWEAT